MKAFYTGLACTLLAATTVSASAQDSLTLRREIESALIRASESGTLADAGASARITSHGGIRYELGAVVDGRRSGTGGVKVLAVTPGSAAWRLDLRPGDQLLSINGRSVAGQDVQQAVNSGGGKLDVSWLRAGTRMAATDRADAVMVPAYQLTVGARSGGGCGFVSDRQGVVPKNEDIFPAEITRIDGRSTPLNGLYQYELPAGQHVLTVAEHVDVHRFSMQQSRQIALSNRLKTARQIYKTLVVDVKPNMTYRIGARLNRDRMDTESIRRNAYWDPVIWESRAQPCR